MATTQETIDTLVNARNALVAETNGLSTTAGQYLWTAIDDINDEIDQLLANALATADYIPQTNAFQSATSEGKQFIGTLNDIKSIFSGVAAVVQAVISVLGIILKI